MPGPSWPSGSCGVSICVAIHADRGDLDRDEAPVRAGATPPPVRTTWRLADVANVPPKIFLVRPRNREALDRRFTGSSGAGTTLRYLARA
jgi:hypothetical protein